MTLRSYPSRSNVHSAPGSNPVTKRLTLFNQIILVVIALAVLMLISANLLMHHEQNSSKVSPSNQLGKHREYSQAILHQNLNIPFERPTTNFGHMQEFQRQHVQFQHETLHSSESLDEPGNFLVEHPLPVAASEGGQVFTGDTLDQTSTDGQSQTFLDSSNTQFSVLSESSLPTFSNDYSEFLFNSLIEIANEHHTKYYLTTQLLSHYNLRPSEIKRLKILKSHKLIWENALNQFQSVKYYPNGKRRERPYLFCRISYPKWDHTRHSWYVFEETIAADFIPNRLTSHPSVNKRIDVMRCPLNETDYQSFLHLLGGEPPSSNVEQDTATQLQNRRLRELFWSEKNADSHQQHPMMRVEILKEDKPIIHYSIDLRTRMTGYLMDFVDPSTFPVVDHPIPNSPDSSSLQSLTASLPSSRLSMWPAVEYDNNYHYHLFNFSPKIFLCVPQIIKPLSKNNIVLFLEFISHHLNIGVEHIFFPTIWSKDSPHYQRFKQLLISYINEGKVSIISQASNYKDDELINNQEADGVKSSDNNNKDQLKYSDIPFEFYGILWDKFFLKTLQSNTLLYLSKGIADYILYLDIDQFFIPKLPQHQPGLAKHFKTNQFLPTLILKAIYSSELLNYGPDLLMKLKEGEGDQWKGGAGWADQHHHPLCYLAVGSEAMLPVKGPKQYDRNWLGLLFHHGSEKAHNDSSIQKKLQQDRIILPTHHIYYTGSYHPGACRLSWQFNGCHNPNTGFCFDPSKSSTLPSSLSHADSMSGPVLDHRFDETVTPADSKHLNPDEDAVIYHYSYYDRRVSASAASIKQDNLYTSYYFPLVYQDLARRGLALLIDLPDSVPEAILGKNKQLNITILSSKDVIDYDVKMENDDLEGKSSQSPEEVLTDFKLHIPKAELTSLPSFATDLSEIILHSLIERGQQSYDLSVTTFLVNHQFIHTFGKRINPSSATSSKEDASSVSHQIDVQSFLSTWNGFEAIHPNVVPYWQEILSKFEETVYVENQGIRMTKPSKQKPMDVANRQKFQCRIRNMVTSSSSSSSPSSEGDAEYLVDGIFVPHYFTSEEEESIIQVDILRCPLGNTQFLYRKYANSEEEINIQVEIIKNDLSIIHFVIPWKERNTGLMSFPSSTYSYDHWEHHLFHQDEENQSHEGGNTPTHQMHHGHHVGGSSAEEEDDHETEFLVSSSREMSSRTIGLQYKQEALLAEISALTPVTLEAWKGVSPTSGYGTMDKVYVALIMEEEDPTPRLLEFLEYYLTILQVDHVIIASPFSWISGEMKGLLRSLQPYLIDKKVSIISMMDPSYHTSAADEFGNVDETSSVIVKSNFLLGAILAKQSVHHMFQNICLYYLKGLVEVFSAVKLSDFIVPVTSLQTIIPQNLNAKPQNHLQQLLQQSFLDDKKDIKNTCLIKIPRKTLIQVYGEDIIADTQENDRLFRFLPYTSSSSASKNKNVSIVQLTNDYSSAESFLIPTNNIFYISTVNAGGNRKSDETSQSLKASRVYACKVPFPYHGCNDRRTFCLKEDETNHSPAIESLTPVYFDDRNINEDYILTVKEESLTLYHMTEKTASQLNEDQELITTAFTDNNMLELFSSKRSPSRSGDSILTTPITQALISKNRFLPFLLPDSLSNSDIRLLTQQYQRKLVSSFANALHVKYQMEDSRVEEVLETLPAMTRDKETLIISSMWETTSPLIIAETEMISVVHLVISSESSYWTDFSSIEARSPSPDSASATPAWQSYQCKVIISPFDKVITSQTIYEELADGIGLIRCLITLPKDILSATPPEQLLVAKPNSFKVALVKPLSKGVFSRLRGGVNGELDDAGTVLKYELTDHTLGKGLLFPLPLSSKQNNKEAVEVEKKYNQLFHPVNSILKSPLPSIVPKEKSETALNLCFSVPWENLMNKQTLSLLVESLLHHYHLGIHHIFLSIRLYSLSTNEDDYNDRLLYLQALKPFLQKQQLTIFFISSPIPSTKNAPTPSEANSQALSSQMLHHFEFLQQYTMTLALLLSRGQGVRLLSYWKTHQLLILPPLFDPLQWKEYHAHHQGHHNESNIKENSNKVEQGVKIGFDGIEMDANKVSDVIGKKRNTIEEFIDKMIKLSKKEKEDIQKEEKYYFLHSLPIPSRELTNHLLFLQKEGKGGVGSSSSNNANTNKQFLGDTYQLSPNYYHYYFHYYSKRFFQNNYNNNYANYLNNFLYDHYHNNLIQDDPTMPSFDFGFILHLPSITPPSTSTSSNENKVGGGVVSSSTSPFLQFLWYNYLPTSYKGKKLNKNFLLRMNTNIIHFTIAELYSYYDYQNIYNLQQILVKNLNNPLQSLTMNKKNDRRRVRLLRRKLQTIEELTIKDQHDHNLINDLLLVNGNELLRNAEEEAANEFAEEEKQRASGRINNNNNDGNNGNGFQEFFSNLVSKIRKSDSSPSEIEKELSSIQSNLHGRDEIEEDAGTSSSTTVTTSANNNNNNNNKGRTNSFQTIFSYYQRKDQSFTNKLFFIYFLNVHSLPLPINTTENINQRYEIVIERDHEKNQLIMKQRAEIIEGYDTSMYYEEFVKNKVDINTFLIEEVSHDLNSNNPHQKEGEEVGKRGNNNNKEEDMKTIRDHRTLEEYYRLLQRNIYSYEYYPSLLFESSSSSSSSSSSLSSLNLLKENYDILFQQNPIQKIIMSKEEKQRKNKAMKTSSSSFNSQFPDFLTVYKTRFSHE